MMSNSSVIISQEVKLTPQRGKVLGWIMYFNVKPDNYLGINIATGWTMCINPYCQVQIRFSSKERAIQFAIKNNYKYSILELNISCKSKRIYYQYINNYK
ncbi:NADH dehydrogenase ubiquinone Fe-S protein 4 [Candidatus Fokinia crypta]|nr:NADH dehydrogenase ubiquinone Fe-S protein 4 [Candidatus Fokinia cryptica]